MVKQTSDVLLSFCTKIKNRSVGFAQTSQEFSFEEFNFSNLEAKNKLHGF
jgi:hypothetical protein